MAKTPKHSTPPPLDTKSQTYVFDEYYSLKDMRMQPASEMFVAKIAHKLMEWARKKDSFIISDFYLNEDICKDTFYSWVKKHDKLKKANEYAKEMIAGRLFKGALVKDYSEGLVSKSMPIYSDTFRDYEEWRAKLGEKVDGATQINLYMEKFPSSDKVPALKKDD